MTVTQIVLCASAGLSDSGVRYESMLLLLRRLTVDAAAAVAAATAGGELVDNAASHAIAGAVLK